MPKYRLVVFDSDGTLTDSLSWFAQAFNELAPTYGFQPVDAVEQEVLRHLSGREMLRRLGIPLWKVPQLLTEVRRLMAAHIGEFSLFDGIEQSLRQLSDAGVELGVVSSNSTENIRHILGPDNAARIAHFHCGASMFGKAAKIRALLKDADVSPHESIYVGDEVRDAEAAAKVGMAYGAVGWGYHKLEALRPHAAEVFLTPREIAGKLLSHRATPPRQLASKNGERTEDPANCAITHSQNRATDQAT